MSYLTADSARDSIFGTPSPMDAYRRLGSYGGSSLHSDRSSLDDTHSSYALSNLSSASSLSEGSARYSTPPPRYGGGSSPRTEEYTRPSMASLLSPAPGGYSDAPRSSYTWADRYSDVSSLAPPNLSRATEPAPTMGNLYGSPDKVRSRYEDEAASAPSNTRRSLFPDHGFPAQLPASMTHSPFSYRTAASGSLVPPQSPSDSGKYTVVFDLDETLVYARGGPILSRPGAAQVLRSAADNAEVIIWTAGERGYAMNAVRQLDPSRSVKHTVSRDGRWFAGDGVKDLRKLGRDVSKTIIIENTPDCIRNNTDNAVLLPDFTGTHCSGVLAALEKLIIGLTRSGQPVSEYLANSSLVTRRRVPCTDGQTITAYVLVGHDPVIEPRPAARTQPYAGSVFSAWHSRY
ncbi:Mitochondrial import inner membrane translocase subunit tim50 [Diplonema papillatum]|nr:Mitochondrial import inner membrane translocase subunit tim50 [Diplonema papillatum]